jgi:hypothetical protein
MITMFLKRSHYKNGRTYLSISEGYRENGRVRTRTVEKCGYLDVLEKEYEDPIGYFKKRAKALSEKKAARNEPVALEFYPAEKIDLHATGNVKNIGHVALSRIYHMLGIDRFWINRKSHTGFGYDPNAIFRMLVYMRVIAPKSKLASWKDKDVLLDRCGFSDDDVYRALTYFAKHSRDLIGWIDGYVSDAFGRDVSRAFYDVTNYYFEIEAEDGLRRRGVSKEHRPNPIVQMGLMLDASGIPIDYGLYPGNTNDCATLLPALKSMKARHKAGHTVVIADKGLNTSLNIAACILDGNGYIFSQSVRKAKCGLKEWVLDANGYIQTSKDFKIKSRQSVKTVYVDDTKDDGKVHRTSVDVPVKEVAFWSHDYEVRSRTERDKVIEKSMSAIASGELSANGAHSATRYVKDTPYVKATGEVACHGYAIDTDKIEKDKRYDGYYCIITSETDMEDGDVIDAYRGLWRIEETFRVTKSVLSARPVYVSRQDHIEAHFLICFCALLIVRLIQKGLDWRYSASAIVDAISHMTGHLMDKNYYLFSYRTPLTDELGKLCDVDLTRKVLSLKQMKDILATTKKN